MVNSLFCNNQYLIFFLCLCYSCGTLSFETLSKIPPNMQDILNGANISEVHGLLNGTRRIVAGEKVIDDRHYMVYLKLPTSSSKYKDYRHWLCGGVIIHEEYILTSAACIEDARHFYVVSGTYRYDAEFNHKNNPCIKNGAKKAIWKCIPRNYVFDGHENDNIRWMNNDIAIVKVEDEFDFTRQIRGCDFIPQPIRYNNHSKQLESPGNDASIVGWGSTLKYSDVSLHCELDTCYFTMGNAITYGVWDSTALLVHQLRNLEMNALFINHRAQSFSQDLLEAHVKIISKKNCKRRWGRRYHNIIENYMICSKDNTPDLSAMCQEKYTDCTDIMYSEESDEEEHPRRVLSPKNLVLHSAYHNATRRRVDSGGFCENDHGGPLVYGTGVNAIVIGIISACLVKEETNKCYGPFLYTSVYKNKMLITCAIYKNVADDCNKLFRTSETHDETDISWIGHPDGPAKNEINKTRRDEEEKQKNEVNRTGLKVSDTIIQHKGVILRSSNDTI